MAQSVVLSDGQFYLLEPLSTARLPIRAARALVSPSVAGVPVRLLNPGTEPITIHKGTKIAQLEPVDGLTICPVTEGDNLDGPITATDNLSPEKKEMLRQMVRDAESQLTEMEMEKLLQLLLSYADVFADSQEELGRTEIHTGDARPIHQAPRRIPAGQQEEVRTLLQNMQKRDIIRPSKSP